MIAVIFLVCSLGCSKEGRSPGANSYSVEYKITDSPAIKAVVSGPAVRIAVLLTDPKGETQVRNLEREEMISNRAHVLFGMDENHAGTWILAVKTFDPERVVWKKEIVFSASHPTIEGVVLQLLKNTLGDSCVLITMQKDGNLPVRFGDFQVSVDGQERALVGLLTWVMIDQRDTFSVPFYCGAFQKKFVTGERHRVKLGMSFGKDQTPLEYEKELVVSGGEENKERQDK